MSRTGAVVVTHRTPVRAARCAEALRLAGADEVVVVDSGSDDGSVVALRADGHEVVAAANVGFGRAANAGVAALSDEVDVVAVCNADTVWEPGSLDRLAAAVRADDTIAAAGPQVRYPDGRLQASARQVPGPLTAVMHALLGLWWPTNRWTRRYRQVDVDPTIPRDVDWLSGCAFAVDRRRFLEVGGFDPGYFLYVEDVDLSVRLRHAGGRLVTAPDAVVVHEVGASTRQTGPERVLHHARGLDRYAGTHLLTGARRVLRPVLRVLLAGWAGVALLWGATVGRLSGRSTTGE